jgi:signal transduction histidine kinase
MTDRSRRLLLYVGTPALLVAVTWADYATGYDFGFFLFYFAPVALAAWYGGRRPGVAYALAAGACWFASDWLSNHPYPHPLVIYWETFMRLASFLTTALALSQIRAELRKREEVLDVISHDLRSPLTALVGQAQALKRRMAGDAFVSARADAILRSASRMDAMIEDLLDSARQRSNQLALRIEPVAVEAYLSELLEHSAPLLDLARVRLVLRPGAGPLVARADPGRLDRIVLNLVLNGLKYSPPGSPVELGAGRAEGWIEISVSDRGLGIPAEDLPHVFDRFYRGKGTAARGGLGLGLYSVRLLVEAQRGTVRVGTNPAGGATFVVALPAAESPPPPAPRASAPA